ncbi:MAG: HAD family phosphatase [Pseudomonadota bacterium]
MTDTETETAETATPIEAVIFDCDGVLIDSETISGRIWAEEVARYGYTLTPQEFARRFAGRPAADTAKLINQASPRKLPDDFARTTDEKVAALYADELETVEGIEDLLASLAHLPIAVASSSGIPKLRQGLVVTNLMRTFHGHVYSAEQVARGKPAPDLFLFAAEKLEIAPARCAVIEDSIAGVHAAKSAGMIPIGFTGTAPEPDLHGKRLTQVGARLLVHRHADMMDALASLDPQVRGLEPV